MSDSTAAVMPSSSARAGLMFPALDDRLVARIAAHGVTRPVRAGEVLIEAGEPVPHFFVLMSGKAEVVRPSNLGDTRVAVHAAGAFTGEANMLLGRRSLVRTTVTEPGEAIELTHDQLRVADSDGHRDCRRRDAGVHLPAPGAGRARRRRRGARRIDAFVRDAPHPRVPHAQRPSVRVHGSGQRPGRSARAGSIPRVGRRDPRTHLPRRCAPQESHQSGDRRLPGLQRRDRDDAPARRPRGRCRAVGPCGRRLRRVGGAGRARPRIERAGRTGGGEHEDRELPRLSEWRDGRGTDDAGADAGAEVRRRDHGGPRRHAAVLRTEAIRRPDGQRPGRAREDRHHRDGRGVSQAQRSRTCRASWVPASTTARRRWSGCSATTRK